MRGPEIDRQCYHFYLIGVACVMFLISVDSDVVFLSCRYRGDAHISLKASGISAGIQDISVSFSDEIGSVK